ncbi:MAG: hypothetical protein E6Q74_04175 [Pseudoxanthomonas sp.]|nr:MAG: hypothetical protein E6Q74_04175 [Pseudoxanthomonas sp.]
MKWMVIAIFLYLSFSWEAEAVDVTCSVIKLETTSHGPNGETYTNTEYMNDRQFVDDEGVGEGGNWDGGVGGEGGYPEPPSAAFAIAGCPGDATSREQAAWAAYRAWQASKNPAAPFAQISADASFRMDGGTVMLMFWVGDVGTGGLYERTDSEYRATDGMRETVKPGCGG